MIDKSNLVLVVPKRAEDMFVVSIIGKALVNNFKLSSFLIQLLNFLTKVCSSFSLQISMSFLIFWLF